MIEFRDVEPNDVPFLKLFHKWVYPWIAQDDDPFDEEQLTFENLYENYTMVFLNEEKDIIGSMSFDTINSDLRASLHFAIRPSYIKSLLRDNIHLYSLMDRFKVLKVKRFVLAIPEYATTAKKLAIKTGFKYIATFEEDVYRGGKPCNVDFYQMTKKDLAKQMVRLFIEENADVADEVLIGEEKVTPLRRNYGRKRKLK